MTPSLDTVDGWMIHSPSEGCIKPEPEKSKIVGHTACPSAGETRCSSLGFGAWPHHFQCHHQRMRGGARQGARNMDFPVESQNVPSYWSYTGCAFESKFPVGDVWCMNIVFTVIFIICIYCIRMYLLTFSFFKLWCFKEILPLYVGNAMLTASALCHSNAGSWQRIWSPIL